MYLPEVPASPSWARLGREPEQCARRVGWVCFPHPASVQGHLVVCAASTRSLRAQGRSSLCRRRSLGINVRWAHVPSLEWGWGARVSQLPREESSRHSTRATPVCVEVLLILFFYSSVFLCFETKAQLMDSWRSEDPLPGATLMYCCPISAFNWCP